MNNATQHQQQQHSKYIRNVMPLADDYDDYDEMHEFLQNESLPYNLQDDSHPSTAHLLKRRKIKKRQ